MKKKVINGILTIVFGVLVIALVVVIFGNFTAGREDFTPERTMAPVEGDVPSPTPPPIPDETPEPEDDFVQEGESATSMRLAVAGDIVCHSGLNQEALQDDGSYDYSTLLGGATGYLQAADYSVACIETTFPETTEYTGYPMFKSPEGLATSLAGAGIDMLSTASNHAMDSLKNGLNRTLDILDANGIDHVGTYRTQEERDENNGIRVVEVNGISIAFLAFTYGTNGIPLSGAEYAVNVFYEDYLTDLSIIDYDMLKSDMAAARALGADLIAVWMHWGYEYYTTPVDYQYELADFMFAEGVDIILGGHTHVPQPMEMREVIDNEGNEKTGYICYSLGNFISCQNDRYTNLTAIVNIDIEKNQTTGETRIKRVAYAPMFMVDLEDYGIYDAGWRYRLWDLHAAINNYESGDDMGVVNNSLYQALLNGLEDVHSVLGEEMDMYA